MALLRERGSDSSACPSEVARRLREEDWRDLMEQVHEQIHHLHQRDCVVVTQGGEPVDPTDATGPVRIRLS